MLHRRELSPLRPHLQASLCRQGRAQPQAPAQEPPRIVNWLWRQAPQGIGLRASVCVSNAKSS